MWKKQSIREIIEKKAIRKRNLTLMLFSVVFCFGFYAEERLKNPADTLELKSVFMLESERKDGEFVTGDPQALGFKPYDGKYLPLDPSLKTRMLTFRYRFNLDTEIEKTSVSAYIGPASYPFNVYLNGKLIYRAGRNDGIYNSTLYDSAGIMLSRDLLNFGDNPNELAIQVLPKKETVPMSPVSISSSLNVAAWVYERNLFGHVCIQAFFIIALVIGLYFLALFVSRKGDNRLYLFYFLLCVAFCLSYSHMMLYNDGSIEVILEKTSRIGMLLITTLAAFFISEYSRILRTSVRLKFAIGIPVLIASISIAIQPDKAAVNSVFSIFSNVILAPLLGFSLILLILGLIKKTRTGILVLFIGFTACIAASVHDIVYTLIGKIPFVWMIPYGFITFLLAIFFILALEQSRIYQESLERERELKIKNLSLSSIMGKIVQVSENLIHSSKKLEENIQSTSSVVEDYGMGNRQIHEQIERQFSGIENEIDSIAQRIDASKDRIPRAVMNQTKVVGMVNRTLSEMNGHIETTMRAADETNSFARGLSEKARKSTRIILESKKSIAMISNYSEFIREVLDAIEDIAERTNILSINAAIEASKAGVFGKGFLVVAAEIRNLANQSTARLAASFEKIREMLAMIEKSSTLSDEVSRDLFEIIEESGNSASNVERISGFIREQEKESSEILKSVSLLFEETEAIKDLSLEEEMYNGNLKQKLQDIKFSLSYITEQLRNQEGKLATLLGSTAAIGEVMTDNLRNIEILKGSINSDC